MIQVLHAFILLGHIVAAWKARVISGDAKVDLVTGRGAAEAGNESAVAAIQAAVEWRVLPSLAGWRSFRNVD